MLRTVLVQADSRESAGSTCIGLKSAFCPQSNRLCGQTLDKDNLNGIFGDAGKKNVSVHLTGISPGKYRIKKLALNSRHGSVLDEWNKMTGVYDLSPKEIDHLKNVSQPAMSIYYDEVSGGITVNAGMDITKYAFFRLNGGSPFNPIRFSSPPGSPPPA